MFEDEGEVLRSYINGVVKWSVGVFLRLIFFLQSLTFSFFFSLSFRSILLVFLKFIDYSNKLSKK